MNIAELKDRHEKAGEYFGLGRFRDSLKILDGLVERFPKSTALKFQKALCHAKLGEAAQAEAMLKKLPKSVGAKRLARLRRLIDQIDSGKEPPPLPFDDNSDESLPGLPAAASAGQSPFAFYTDRNQQPPLAGKASEGTKCGICGDAMSPGDLICMQCGHVHSSVSVLKS